MSSTGDDRLEVMEQQMRLMQEQLQSYRNVENKKKKLQAELQASQVQLREAEDARNDQFFDTLRKTLNGEQPQKKPKREFTPHGDKIVPAKYEHMNTKGLLTIQTVDHNVRDKIARNEFVELVSLHKVKKDAEHSRRKQSGADADESASKTSIKDRPEFFLFIYINLVCTTCNVIQRKRWLSWNIWLSLCGMVRNTRSTSWLGWILVVAGTLCRTQRLTGIPVCPI